jgi:hypothetical protein
MRVIDHHALHGTAHIAQRIGEKYLAIESLERWIDLEKQHARITQNSLTTGEAQWLGLSGDKYTFGLRLEASRLCLVLKAAHFDFVRRGIVLQFHAWLEVILTRRHHWCLPNALSAAERRQRRIR